MVLVMRKIIKFVCITVEIGKVFKSEIEFTNCVKILIYNHFFLPVVYNGLKFFTLYIF